MTYEFKELTAENLKTIVRDKEILFNVILKIGVKDKEETFHLVDIFFNEFPKIECDRENGFGDEYTAFMIDINSKTLEIFSEVGSEETIKYSKIEYMEL